MSGKGVEAADEVARTSVSCTHSSINRNIFSLFKFILIKMTLKYPQPYEFHLVSKIIEKHPTNLSTVIFCQTLYINADICWNHFLLLQKNKFYYFPPRPWGWTIWKSRRNRRSTHTRQCPAIFTRKRETIYYDIIQNIQTFQNLTWSRSNTCTLCKET